MLNILFVFFSVFSGKYAPEDVTAYLVFWISTNFLINKNMSKYPIIIKNIDTFEAIEACGDISTPSSAMWSIVILYPMILRICDPIQQKVHLVYFWSDTFENTSFTKCEFPLFSLYFTHYFAHYLRINLADKMSLLLYWVTFRGDISWKIGRDIQGSLLFMDSVTDKKTQIRDCL